MESNKITAPILIIVSFIAIAAIVFWVPSFFTDEFYYVGISFANESVNIEANPGDLFEKEVGRWTDISATFTNNSNKVCEVVIKSETLNETFSLNSGFQYGLIFPKGEDITILFCGQEEIIRI